MDLTVDFKSFQEQVSSSLVNATRTANQIANEDLSFHRSSSGKLSKALDAQNAHLLQLTNKLFKAATKDSNIRAPKLQNQDSVDDNWRSVIDVIDDLLEKADASLDEFTGVLKRSTPPLQDGTEIPTRKKERAQRIPNIFSNALMRKPQLDFHTRVNNFETAPFKPLLKFKPHASISLEDSIAPGDDGVYKHPYAYEIENFKYLPTTKLISAPMPFTPPGDSEAVLVDTEEGLLAMLSELRSAKEIAIDLEHHDMHSYVGLVCLMQISTREKDWIVDTLKPWRENMQVLNEVFANPNILKVFHGSSMDMIWLQRDLGLYVVGLFDTYHASVALEFPRKGLAYLLDRFAGFKAEKKYQMADWRIRPLPVELIDYARSDTHYLLFIYDNLRNMLAEASLPGNNLIDHVLSGSKREALQVYERPIYNYETGLGSCGWFKPLTQRSIKFDNVQFAIYRAVHQWRDHKARVWDEGEQYILTASGLWEIAEKGPASVPALHATLRPISRPVAENAKELIEIIRKAKFEGQTGPSVREIIRENEQKFGVSTIRTRQTKPSLQSEYQGVGKTMQMLAEKAEFGAEPLQGPAESTKEVVVSARSTSSQLWGPTVSNVFSGLVSSFAAATDALRSVLPLPPLSETAFSNSLTQSSVLQEPIITSPSITANPQKKEKKNEIFVIRDSARSNKRKAEEEIDGPDAPERLFLNGENSSIATVTALPSQPFDLIVQEDIRKQEKQRQKAEKRLKKEAQNAEATAAQAQLQAERPFDYANAASVLNAKPDEEALNGSGSAKAKPLNPFAKALDTSTGARRPKQAKEAAGKSMTFKS